MRILGFALVAGLIFCALMSVLSLNEGGPAQSHPQTSSSGEVIIMEDHVIIDGKKIPLSDSRAQQAFKMAGDDRERALADERALAQERQKRQWAEDEAEALRNWTATQRLYDRYDREWEMRTRTPRYPYSNELNPPQRPFRSDVIPRSNGEVHHTTNGRISHTERPAWTQKRRD